MQEPRHAAADGPSASLAPLAMNVLLVPLGPPVVASSRIRVYQYLPHLASHGIQTRVVPFMPAPDVRRPSRLGSARRAAARLRTLERVCLLSVLASRYDVTLIQRVLLPDALQRLIARRARRLVFDIDDAVYTTHPGMLDADRWASRARPRFEAMVARSRAVFASTPTLAAEARRGEARVFELPSPVDCDRYRPREGPPTSRVVVGWIGDPSTTMYLLPLLPVCRRLAARHPAVRFEAVGADPAMDLAPFRIHPWSLETELHGLGELDIGIMPLSDDEWARGKAGYKLLQYMACGIASVASPVGVNAELLGDGARGLAAVGPRDWEDALTALIEDATRRRRLAVAGRQLAEREYSLAVWAPRYRAALEAVAREA
jgi:glycosyltransferase involved in cell wall biosynthesis